MLRRRPKEKLPTQKHPGDPEPETCAPGSIEQQLDMCEEGSLRGDEILHHPGEPPEEADESEGPPPLNRLANRFRVDLSEEDREGAEASGDEHSGGLQGGEPEIESQLHLNTGLPGDRTRHQEIAEKKDWALEGEEYPEGAPRKVIRRAR